MTIIIPFSCFDYSYISYDFYSDSTAVVYFLVCVCLVARRVVNREEHTLDGASLKVVLGKSEHNVITEETSSCDSRIVEVTGLASVTTEDVVCNYFENTRRSGGGEVESVEMKPELNMAIVTFKKAEGSEIMWSFVFLQTFT